MMASNVPALKSAEAFFVFLRQHKGGVLCCEQPARDGSVAWCAQLGIGGGQDEVWQGPRQPSPDAAAFDVVSEVLRRGRLRATSGEGGAG